MTVFLLELCKVHYRLLTGFSDRVHILGLVAGYGVFGNFGNTYRFQERAVFGIERSLTFQPSHNGTLYSACYTLWCHDFCPPDRFCGPMDRFFGVLTDCLLVWLRWLLWFKLWDTIRMSRSTQIRCHFDYLESTICTWKLPEASTRYYRERPAALLIKGIKFYISLVHRGYEQDTIGVALLLL